MRDRHRLIRLILGAACVALVALALAACGSDDGGDSGGGGADATASEDGATTDAAAGGDSGGLADAKKTTEDVIAGARFGEPPTDPNPAATGKTVWIVSAGQSSPTAKAVTAGVEAGVKAIGWDAKVCDGKLDPSAMARCWEDAIAAKPDGVFGVATDCTVVKGQLEKAKAAGIITIPTYGWDCDEVGAGEGLYTEKISFGDRYANGEAYYKKSGEDVAAWTVASTEGEADVLDFVNQEYDVLKFYQAGFDEGMAKYCPDCKVTDVPYLAKDFGPNFQAKAAAAMTKNPTANAIQGTYNPQLGITQAVVAAGKQGEIDNIGGLGLGIDADVIRENKGLTATLAQPLEWIGFTAVDTMNSVFNKTDIRDGGVGYTIFDAENNLPPKGQDWNPTPDQVDYKAAFLESWGK